MKRKQFRYAGIAITLPVKMFKELSGLYKLVIEKIGYDEMEKRFPTVFHFFLRDYEKKKKTSTS